MSASGLVPSASIIAPIAKNPATISSDVIMQRNYCSVSSESTNSNSRYVYHSSSNSTCDVCRDVITQTLGGSAFASLGVLHEDSGVKKIQSVTSTCPESSPRWSCNLTLDGNTSWDGDDACLDLSANKAFRFKFVETD